MTSLSASLAAALAVIVLAAARRPWPARAPVADAPASERPGGDTPEDGVSPRWWRRQDRRARPEAVADWCDELARRLRSSATLHDALTATVPTDVATRTLTDPVRHALARGRSTSEALQTVTATDRDRSLNRDLDLALHALSVVAQVGGAPGAAIDRTAAALRQRAADGAERAAQSAQARMSAHVLTVLPVAVLVLLAVIDPDVRSVAARPIGTICLSVGLALNVAGWCWMRHVVRSER